ncbi:Leu/Phe/Val dehydrogenase [Sneathiella limimaris]|uniref:Leu/Phe/Val dehydrogenase n=1 Tax=Sneathiella limimaris TaxID=1964213 RepID=UPI00146B9BB3|nr:Glu/Leu/Phe/Val dehydrogenase [Sneathiella limimaris]
MTIFSNPEFDNHETVLFFKDPKTGLKAIIAIHDTTLGPALGGTRMWNYGSEEEALTDVLRLSRGMTYKSSLTGLNLGGGKSVIIGDAKTQKSPELFRAFGEAVGRLNGNYIAAEDVGTSVEDLEYARQSTSYIAGISEGGAGDPSPATSWGVFNGLKAAAKYGLNATDLKGVRVAVQGLGHVGYGLCKHLREAGAELIVTDIYDQMVQKAVAEFDAKAVKPEEIIQQDVDIFAPCALGAVLNDETIPELKAKIIAGAANNQLAEDRHGQILRDKGILYAPDYVINAGGIILISHEGPTFNRDKAMKQVAEIHDTLLNIFTRADRENRPTHEIAYQMARERIENTRLKMAS